MQDGQAQGRRGLADVHVERWNASRRVTRAQSALLIVIAAGFFTSVLLWPAQTGSVVRTAGFALLASVVVLRFSAAFLARKPAAAPDINWADLPTYTVVAPMYREASVCAQLVAHLDALVYPRERLQVLLVLEEDDRVTLAQLRSMALPPAFQVFVAPAGWPKTKPRACNEALRVATGELLVIYDAEDRPEPLQLLEAAARFAGSPKTACFQAPLRIDHVRGFLGAQFAFEYAAQFETLMPALQRLNAPFPLGGSSNHFRTAVLRTVGGWDAHNVTEDADLGFRLAAAGMGFGLLTTPTWEEPPHTLREWLPQRARWVKGHAQTWLVQMRRPLAGGPMRLLAMQATIGIGVVSATAHGPLAMYLLVEVAFRAIGWGEPAVGAFEAGLLASSWTAALTTMRVGARRAGAELSWRDACMAPLYWPLHSLAAARALWQLAVDPFHWDKTDHRPVPEALAAGREAG